MCIYIYIYIHIHIAHPQVIYDLLAPRTKGGQRSGGLEARHIYIYT